LKTVRSRVVRRMRWKTTGKATARAPRRKRGVRKVMRGKLQAPNSKLQGSSKQQGVVKIPKPKPQIPMRKKVQAPRTMLHSALGRRRAGKMTNKIRNPNCEGSLSFGQRKRNRAFAS